MSETEEVNQKSTEPKRSAPSLSRVCAQELGFLAGAVFFCFITPSSFWMCYSRSGSLGGFFLGGIGTVALLIVHIGVVLGGSKLPGASALRSVGLILNGFAMVFVLWVFTHPALVADYGLRARAREIVGLGELQTWAVGLLSTIKEEDGDIDRNDPRFSDTRVVEFVNDPYFYKDDIGVNSSNGNEKCISIMLGGGFWHYGVCVGAKTFVLEDLEPQGLRKRYFRWADGIYGYQD